MKHPSAMTHEEFFQLPIHNGSAGLQDLARRDAPTGFIDGAGAAWRWVLLEDGTYARERLWA